MMRRHEITDEHWGRIKDLLPGQPGDPGVTAKDNRLFVNAVLWIAKTGAPWRDLPERFGLWGSAWKRFDRWAKKGVWKRVFEALQDPDLEWMIIDSTVVRAHQHAAGKKGGKAMRPSAVPGADSAPRSTSSSTPSATRSSSS
jgi:transposase